MPSHRTRVGFVVSVIIGETLALGCRVETAASALHSKQDPADNFLQLKQLLTGDYADIWWWDLRGKWSPAMKLWVVSISPQDRPTTYLLSPERGGAAEVTLHLEPGYGQES